MNGYFYGWYFRCQSEEKTVAIIPAVHLSEQKKSCSIQVITEEGAWNKEFPIEQFRKRKDKLALRIGDQIFSQRGLFLNLEENEIKIKGRLVFGKFTKPKYDIMGPFRYIPGMECRHAVYSMCHSVNGTLFINGKKFYFKNAMGYMEGDSGISFPKKYAWTQHFFEEGSLVLAAAQIPWAGFCFMGTIGIVWWRGKEYRFATYLGAYVIKMERGEIWIKQRNYQLRVKLLEKDMRLLQAPYKGKMIRKIGENPSCRVKYCMMNKDKVLFQFETDRAAFEYEVFENYPFYQ